MLSMNESRKYHVKILKRHTQKYTYCMTSCIKNSQTGKNLQRQQPEKWLPWKRFGLGGSMGVFLSAGNVLYLDPLNSVYSVKYSLNGYRRYSALSCMLYFYFKSIKITKKWPSALFFTMSSSGRLSTCTHC